MVVHARQHDNEVLFDHVEQRVGKATQNRPPNLVLDALIELWVGAEMCFSPFNVLDERFTLIDLRPAIPSDGIGYFGHSSRLVTNRVAH